MYISSHYDFYRRQRKKLPPPPPAAEARDWAALPHDILLDVFLKLGSREVMMGAEFACTAWRRVALHEPALYRRVCMPEAIAPWRCVDDESDLMERDLVAVDRAAGQCVAFAGGCNGGELLRLVQSAPSLKHLDIEYDGDNEYGQELIAALKKLPLLEELHISLLSAMDPSDPQTDLLQHVSKACPRIKKLELRYSPSSDLSFVDPEIERELINGGISVMPELRSLELYECDLTGEGLKDILDNCPLLESLCISGYFDEREMDQELREKCAKVKNLILPDRGDPYDSNEAYYDHFED
ncbi:hypothetical protein ACP70R_042803 [Stipagrostis hirtigluma subsp. patula]